MRLTSLGWVIAVLGAGCGRLEPGDWRDWRPGPVVQVDAGTAVGPARVWNLAEDFAHATDPANPFQDRGQDTRWALMMSEPSSHDTHGYRLLPDFVTNEFGIEGLHTWENDEISTGPNDRLPHVGLNTTGTEQVFAGIHWPAGKVILHPHWDKNALVRWTSPSDRAITIRAHFTDLDSTCGDGVTWFIDGASQTLLSGTVANGGRADVTPEDGFSSLQRMTVLPGEELYFGISFRTNDGCDTTALDLEIREEP